jgi:hypothetical protein
MYLFSIKKLIPIKQVDHKNKIIEIYNNFFYNLKIFIFLYLFEYC